VIRAMGYTKAIFGVTGNFYQSDIENFMKAGVDRVLAKPLDMRLFDEAVRCEWW
jgi:hypothetical protein